MIVSLAVLVPWVAGGLAVALDGRRRAVGWAAVAVLAATLALLAVLIAQVLTGPAREVYTGGWPPGVGITLHADVLGAAFALLSVLVLLAATTHEVLAGVRVTVFPGWASCSRAGSRAVPHRRRVQLLPSSSWR